MSDLNSGSLEHKWDGLGSVHCSTNSRHVVDSSSKREIFIFIQQVQM